MRNFQVRRVCITPVLALASLALMLPLASQATAKKSETTPSSTAPAAPHVSTGGVTHVTPTSATLEGSIDPHNLATTYYFQYGATAAYGAQTTPTSLPAGSTTVKVLQAVTGFLQGYHYRLVATNADGMKAGHDRTFTSAKKKSSFELPQTFEPIPLGGAFTLSGTLTGTGNADRQIVLQATPYPYTAPFADVGSPIPTTTTGRFTFRVNNLSTSTKFRVVTVGTTPVTSLIVPQQVTVRVVLKVRTSSRRGLVRLYGTVTPAEVGAHVFFQFEKPPKAEAAPKGERPTKLENPAKGKNKSERSEEKGPKFLTKFSTVVKPGTKAISRFSAVVSVRDAGNYRAFVEVHPGSLASGHSLSVALRAAPATTKKKKNKQ
jgi:hypothetical protein